MQLAKVAPENRTKAETRLIMTRIVIISFVLFFNALCSSFIDAFLPDIMVKFGAAENMTKAGKAAAWVTAGFCAGRFISANLWGAFIDKYGRKPGLMIILGSLVLCSLAFGLATSYTAVIIIRFITGFLNGLSIVAKTISMEVCSDDLKPWSISVTNSIWALGSITGPVFGSLFYKQIESYPILASAILVALVGLTLMPICWYYLDETLPPKQVEHSIVAQDESANTTLTDNENNQLIDRPAPSVFNIPNVGKLIFIYSFNTFFASVFAGLIIFWVSAKYEDGGLDFEYKHISQIFLYFTGPQLLMQILGYPLIQKRIGDYTMLKYGHLVHLPIFFMIPVAHAFGYHSFTSQKLWIVLWLFIRNMASFMNFSAIQRFSNDIVPAHQRGKLNGIQVTFSSGLQIASPLLGKWLLSWSMSSGYGYPFDYHFVFLLMCGITIAILSVIFSLKFTDEKKLKLVGMRAEKY